MKEESISLTNIGKKIDEINVEIRYRIIELFSAGLYSNPIKAVEELVCNSYDAFADKVVISNIPESETDNPVFWVCDNGESMDAEGLKYLWKIGESTKRKNPELENIRLQIGRFGIGKLATYVLANKLTYICKKNDKYLATTMDYTKINDEERPLKLDTVEIEEEEVKTILINLSILTEPNKLPFDLFGENAESNWTLSILTNLKPKAFKIKRGRLRWVLSTALPLNPGFKMFFEGEEIKASIVDFPKIHTWIIGKDDVTIDKMNNAEQKKMGEGYFVDFEHIKGVHGQVDLYEDSLYSLTRKSQLLGRSYGIFLMVRGRLINYEDAELGLGPFPFGTFYRTQFTVHADGLDEDLTSNRESIKESQAYQEVKNYIKNKFTNEVKPYFYNEQNKRSNEKSIAFRMSLTSMTTSKLPLLLFAEKFFENEAINPSLILKPSIEDKEQLLNQLRNDIPDDQPIIKKVEWKLLRNEDHIAKLDLSTGILCINLSHPYIANYSDDFKNKLPLEFIAITEVLTEAHLYELGIDELTISNIMKRRDKTLRELTLSDRESIPVVAQILIEKRNNSSGLEDAVYKAFLALGFETMKIGGNGKPDGKAEAILGVDDKNNKKNYSFTYDAKSTSNSKIKAGTARLSAIKRHQKDFRADFSAVIAIDFEGADDSDSAICKEAKQQEVTLIKLNDLCRLLILSIPKQLGIDKMKTLFLNCHTPLEVSNWLDEIESEEVEIGPVHELIEVIYEFQKEQTEPPEIASVRIKLKEKIKRDISKAKIAEMMHSLKTLIPGFISVEGEYIGVQGRPDVVSNAIRSSISEIPNQFQKLYLEAFKNEIII